MRVSFVPVSRSPCHARAMLVRPLPPRIQSRLRTAPFAVAAGLTTTGLDHPGHRRLVRSVMLRRRDFPGAVEDLLGWQVQARSGLTVLTSDPRVREGGVVQLRLGPGALSLRVPCRVTSVIDEADRAGFTYGTLPGHVETGLEGFLLEREADGRIRFTIAVTSAPAFRLARSFPFVAEKIQDRITDRYLRALDR